MGGPCGVSTWWAGLRSLGVVSHAQPDASPTIERLVAAALSVATAESLTGGQVAAALTAVPGASRVVRGGVVAYATEVKVSVLDVPQEVVDSHGVISAECALAMARGVCRRLGADVGVATTGVAGPDRQEGHPAGTVYVAVSGAAGEGVRRLALEGDRAEVQRQSVAGALALLDEILREEEPAVR